MTSWLKNLLRALVRRKNVSGDTQEKTELNRCLSTTDLTFLGVGGTLGLGIYVLAGQVASTKAGPAVILSFLIAAVASVFSGLCYAEFGARVPRAGSAYVYSYVTVGEFMAFVIGWNLILEYVIGTASVARGYSGYLDSLLNDTIQVHMKEWMPIGVSWMSSYPDLFAFGITLVLTVMLAIGVKESTRFNNLFTGLNLVIVVYVIVCGSFRADLANWEIKPENVPDAKYGKGGFFPYGLGGMLNGAASCFYAFVGFDCIATTGEEVRNPRRAIPISIVISLFIVFLAYFGVSVVETLLWPYYDQNVSAPLPYVFGQVGWPIAKWIISIGALAGLSTSLLGGMFPLPRVLYAMGSDGLIFRFLAVVHPRLKTPLLATAASGIFAGAMAMMFNVEELANMMSIGTLLAYSLVAVSVLMLRYQPVAEVQPESPSASMSVSVSKRRKMYDVARNSPADSSASLDWRGADDPILGHKNENAFRIAFNWDRLTEPTKVTSKMSKTLVLTLGILFFIMNSVLVYAEVQLFLGVLHVCIPFAFVATLVLLNIVALIRQPKADTSTLSFAVPLVPYIPIFNMFVNTYLMLRLPVSTWARFGVWMALGLLIYFGYGISHSSQRSPPNPILTLPASLDQASTDVSDGEKSARRY